MSFTGKFAHANSMDRICIIGLLMFILMCSVALLYLNLNDKQKENGNDFWAAIGKQSLEKQISQDASVPYGDESIVIYNRIPKTGSTTSVGVACALGETNKFNVLNVNFTGDRYRLSLSEQTYLVDTVTQSKEKLPAFYHGHFAYVNFQSYGISKAPIYINVLREPLERLVSHYYFLRYGDDFEPTPKKSNNFGNSETFDECVERDGEDCHPNRLWLQIPFFCGNYADCWIPGNKWALEKAKYNLVTYYLVVGTTEELDDYVVVLEAALPRFFSGAVAQFVEGSISHLRKTNGKQELLDKTIEKMHNTEVWKMENEFYQFAKRQFDQTRGRFLSI